MQVSAVRGYASLPFVLLPAAVHSESIAELKPVRWKLHLMRGVAGGVHARERSFMRFACCRWRMRIRIFLSAPLLVTALSVPMLGEKVGWHRWAAIGIGLCGVLVMLEAIQLRAS